MKDEREERGEEVNRKAEVQGGWRIKQKGITRERNVERVF